MIKITEFERRQMTALKAELDQEYKTGIGLGADQKSPNTSLT